MNQTLRHIINRLVSTDVNELVSFGDFNVDLMFPTGERALLIDFDSRLGWLLVPAGTKSNEILLLTELLSTFRTLESQGLIYLVENQMTLTGMHCKYADSNICDKKEILPYVILNNEKTLRAYNTDGSWLIKKDGNCILTSIRIPDCMFEELVRILYSRIYPTESLRSYQARGFVTENDYYNKKALRYSLISMIIACVIAVASLIFSVPISNKWGKSTIAKDQFDELLHNIGEIKETATKDTVFAIMTKDSIVTKSLK